jgi:hypothetical protein
MEKASKLLYLCLVAAIVIAVLAPLITYVDLTNTYNNVIDSYRNQTKDLQQQIDNLTEQNRKLNEEKAQLTNLTQPYLITSLGWYLHKSNDPVVSSKNTFTIYGKIFNLGLLAANNAEITIKFYGNETLLQTSTVHIGPIQPITNSSVPYQMGNKNVDCSVADSVTNVDISVHYQ